MAFKPRPGWHYLKANKRTEIPGELLFFDCETRSVPIQLPNGEMALRLEQWFGWAAYLRSKRPGEWLRPKWFRFERPEEFWENVKEVHRAKTCLRVLAHNAGFDLRCVDAFRRLSDYYPKVKLACLKAPPLIIDASRPGHRIICLDTLNWWRVSLAELGERIGLPKFDMPAGLASPEEWDRYCRRDVEIIMESMRRWIDFVAKEDLGNFKNTLAGQAFSSFRHRFMTRKILIDRDERGLRLSRAAYHGGRTEAFRLGEVRGPIHHLDINSMYPSVMREERYPVKFSFSRPGRGVAELEVLLKHFSLIAHVRLKTELPIYPYKLEGETFYPVGEFDATLCTPELARAFAEGAILQVYEIAGWRQDYIFKPFVDYMYMKRMEAKRAGDWIGSWLFKIMANSLYGKFGQHGMKNVDYGPCTIEETGSGEFLELDTGRRGVLQDVFCRRTLKLREGESHDSLPAVAAHVTAYARMKLWGLIERAGREEVFYVDTDSLFVSRRGYLRLWSDIDDDALGDLKSVDTYDQLMLFGPKDYVCGGKRTLKGVRASATEVSPGRFIQEHWVGLAGALKMRMLDAPVIRRMTKVLKRECNKGNLDEFGRLSPFRIGLPRETLESLSPALRRAWLARELRLAREYAMSLDMIPHYGEDCL